MSLKGLKAKKVLSRGQKELPSFQHSRLKFQAGKSELPETVLPKIAYPTYVNYECSKRRLIKLWLKSLLIA